MRSQRGFALACALTGTLALAGSAAADTDIQGNQNGLPDLDVRTGKLAPTAAQRTDARDLGAQVAWNQFGTPSSLVRAGGALGATVQGSSATRRRARLAVEQPLALPPDLDAGHGAGQRQRAGRRRHSRRDAAPDDRRARRLGRRHGHHRRDQGRQRLEGRLGVVVAQRRPDARRQGPPARRPGLAGGCCQRRPRQVAGAHRAPARQGRPRPGLEGPARRRPGRRPAGTSGGLPDRLARLHPGLRDARGRHPGGRADRLPRVRRRAQRHRPGAREPRRQRGRHGRRGAAHDDADHRRAAGAGRRLRRAQGSVHRGRRRRRARDRGLRERRRQRQRHRPAALQRRRQGR